MERTVKPAYYEHRVLFLLLLLFDLYPACDSSNQQGAPLAFHCKTFLSSLLKSCFTSPLSLSSYTHYGAKNLIISPVNNAYMFIFDLLFSFFISCFCPPDLHPFPLLLCHVSSYTILFPFQFRGLC